MTAQFNYNDYKEECEKNGVNRTCFYQRVNALHWEIEKAISTPVRKQKKRNFKKDNQMVAQKMQKKVQTKSVSKDTFVPQTNYPSLEYQRYLRFEIKELHKSLLSIGHVGYEIRDAVNDKIRKYKKMIEDATSFYYSAIDMYVVNPKMAQKKHSESVIESIKVELSLPAEKMCPLTRTIYFEFAKIYKLNTILNKEEEE